MDVVSTITRTIEPSLEAMGYRLVLVKMNDGAGRKTLTVMAERQDGQAMSFDDCAGISRMASALLDVEDPITGAYDLEVCSPGIDRPLTRLEDFDRYAGQEARIELMLPVEGRKRFRGTLLGTEGNKVKLAMPEGNAEIDFGNIRIAKLMITDTLATAHPKKQKKG